MTQVVGEGELSLLNFDSSSSILLLCALEMASQDKIDLSEVVPLQPCNYADQCTRRNPAHFQQFSHPCKYDAQCTRRNPTHFEQHTHSASLLDSLHQEFQSQQVGAKRAAPQDDSNSQSKRSRSDISSLPVVDLSDSSNHEADESVEDEVGGDSDVDGGFDADSQSPVSLAVQPLHVMKEGDAVTIQGSSGSSYEIRLRGGIHYCTCPGWKMSPGAVDQKVCKHMREYLGEAFIAWRNGTQPSPSKSQRASSSSSKSTGVKVVPKLLLAHPLTDTDVSGWWCSEKLDGVRAYWNGTSFISRLGNRYVAPAWFVADLPRDGTTLDGELFGGRKLFNKTVGTVKQMVPNDDAWRQLTFQVFDVPSSGNLPFEQRMELMKKLTANCAYAHVVEQVRIKDRPEVESYVDRIIALGGEGAMVRQPGSQYVGSRSNTLFKVKRFSDEEVVVIGHEPGKGKYVGMLGAIKIQLKSGLTCAVGSGFTDDDRRNPPKVGATVTIKYQELTPAGIPRFPIFICERID